MFKAACLSYQPTDINYREKLISRIDMIKLRKSLIEKSIAIVNQA